MHARRLAAAGRSVDNAPVNMSTPKPGFRLKPWQRAVVIVFMLLFAAEFTYRGVIRGAQRSLDLAAIYTGTCAFWETGNPYDDALRDKITKNRVAKASQDDEPALYPPSTYLLTAPMAAVSWTTAKVGWVVVNTGLALGLIALLGYLGGFAWRGDRLLMLAAGILALAPIHTGISLGQISLMGFVLAVASMVLSMRGRPIAAGIALGCAVTVKLTVAAPFVLWMIGRGRGRTTLWTITTIAALLAAGLGWMAASGHNGVALWLDSVRAFRGDRAWGDMPYLLIDLSYPLTMLGVGGAAGLIAKGLTLAGMIAVLIGLRGNTDRRMELTGFAAFCVMMLLPTYHRFYDAAALAAVVAWAIMWITHGLRPRWCGYAGAGLLLVFAAPGAAMLGVLMRQGRIPQPVIDSWAWQVIVLPHQVWASVALSGVLIAAVWLGRRNSAAEATTGRTGVEPRKTAVI